MAIEESETTMHVEVKKNCKNTITNQFVDASFLEYKSSVGSMVKFVQRV